MPTETHARPKVVLAWPCLILIWVFRFRLASSLCMSVGQSSELNRFTNWMIRLSTLDIRMSPILICPKSDCSTKFCFRQALVPSSTAFLITKLDPSGQWSAYSSFLDAEGLYGEVWLKSGQFLSFLNWSTTFPNQLASFAQCHLVWFFPSSGK